MNDTIGNTEVHVPTHLFKVLLAHKKLNDTSQYHLYAFMIKNKQIKHKTIEEIANYSVDLRTIEKLTGLQFFAEKMDAIPIKPMTNKSLQ